MLSKSESISSKLFASTPQVFTRVMAPVSPSSQPGRSVVAFFGRLAGASLIPLGGSEGVGRGTAKVRSLRHCSKPRNFVVSSIPDGGFLGVGSGQLVFAGFLSPKRIETVHELLPGFSVLQAARRGLLARSLGSPDVVVSFGSGGRLRFRSLQLRLRECCDCQRVGLGSVDRQHSFRPKVVVERARYSRRGVARYPSFRLLLLVRRIGSGLGLPCWRLVVSGRWTQWEICLSIILQQLRTIRLGLLNFQCLLAWLSVGVFSDNPSFLEYVPEQGGTHSCLLKVEAHLLLCWWRISRLFFFLSLSWALTTWLLSLSRDPTKCSVPSGP